jgi:hypothetical protein
MEGITPSSTSFGVFAAQAASSPYNNSITFIDRLPLKALPNL